MALYTCNECMNTAIHTCTCTCMHIHVYNHAHTYTRIYIHLHVHTHPPPTHNHPPHPTHLILTGQCQVFDLHLFPPPSREEYLVNTLPVLRVHDGNGTPISAHPEGVSPDSEAGTGEVCTIVIYWHLHLYREEVM